MIRQLGEEILNFSQKQGKQRCLIVSALPNEGVDYIHSHLEDYFTRSNQTSTVELVACDGINAPDCPIADVVRTECAILVIRAGVTDRSQVHELAALLVRNDIEILGSVLTNSRENDVNHSLKSLQEKFSVISR